MAAFPTIILLFTLIPYVSADFQGMLLEYLSTAIPAQAYDVFGATIEDLIKNKRTGVLSISFILVFYYSSRSVSAVLAAFGQSVNLVNKRRPWVQFLASFLIMLVLAILITSALSLVTASDWLASYLDSLDVINDQVQKVFFYIVNYLIVLALFLISIAILYNVGNPDRRRWRIFSAGSTLSSLLMILISVGFATFINEYTSFDELYGYLGSAIGAVIIFCLWLYFNSMVLLIGFELNVSISRAHQFHLSEPESFVKSRLKTDEGKI